MFLLPAKSLPATPAALAEMMEEAVRAFALRSDAMVTVRGANLGNLDLLAIDVSNAIINTQRPPVIPQPLESSPAISTAQLVITADPTVVFDAKVTFLLDASRVQLGQAKAGDGSVLLVLRHAEAGKMRFSAARGELEKLIAKVAARAGAKHGITIESVKVDLRAPRARTLDFKLIVTARKLLFRTALRISGTAAISDDLVATVRDLRCEGDGPMATLACAAIAPSFARVQEQPIPLSAIPVGGIQMRDVQIEVDEEKVVVSGEFGSQTRNCA